MHPFTGNFTQQEPIPEDAIAAAVAVMRGGRLHRYNTDEGEIAPAARLEVAFATYQEAKYCLACASGGYALSVSLRAAGVKPGDKVLTNGFTLAPAPGAIAAVGAEPVLVEITRDLVIDLADLDRKIGDSGARVLMLSHMRGHLVDMEAICALCDAKGVTIIEDCAHTMGARWNGRPSGGFGLAGCFSTQTYKHINSGEGGLLTSDDPEFMARAIMMSGSYMLYERHRAAPPPETFETIRLETPNMSGRMDNLRAAILLPQLETLDANAARWNARYAAIEARLSGVNGLYMPHRPPQEAFVASSIQFLAPGFSPDDCKRFVARMNAVGVELKWFGAADPVAFTSNHRSWRYVPAQDLPATDAIMAGLFDMRLPLTFSVEDCAQIAELIAAEAARI